MAYSQHFLEFVEHFNRGEYRACVEPLEEIWFVRRDNFHKALIRLVVGLNQVTLGLDSGPRFLFATARELLQPYGARHQGLDLHALLDWIAVLLARLDAAERTVAPRFLIQLDPPPDQALPAIDPGMSKEA